jgi:hypothetical protein
MQSTRTACVCQQTELRSSVVTSGPKALSRLAIHGARSLAVVWTTIGEAFALGKSLRRTHAPSDPRAVVAVAAFSPHR